jgi:acyl-CoA dehydrogenase
MDFARTKLELDLERATHAFLSEVVIPYERDPRIGPHGPSDELRRELQTAARTRGLLAPQLSTKFGGHGLNHRQTATVLRAAGYSLLGPLAMNVMAPDEGNMYMLEKIATPRQLESYLGPLARGEIRSCFLMTEPDGGAGSDPHMLMTAARPQGDGWIIDGRKWLITGAQGAALGILMAKTEHGATMFLIDMADPAVRIERVLHTLDNSLPGGHAVIDIKGLRVGPDAVLGKSHEAFHYAQVRLAPARLTHCMRWWGAARRAHEQALHYAHTRKAFGKTLAEHEGVGFMLADNLVDLQQSLLLIDHTAWVLDEGHSASSESSMAKLACSEALSRVVDRAVQVLGGAGVTDDHPVAKIYREIRGFRIYDGASEVHRWSLARRLHPSTATSHEGRGKLS